jgi:hypothetical protein
MKSQNCFKYTTFYMTACHNEQKSKACSQVHIIIIRCHQLSYTKQNYHYLNQIMKVE